ncbi:DUF5320 family protein [bacterium]|nr:DUF5320 family protein [bacterium]
MPRENHQGPRGEGPRSGRGQGQCGGHGHGSDHDHQHHHGGGRHHHEDGECCGDGSHGQGHGHRNEYNRTGLPGWMRPCAVEQAEGELDRAGELALLRKQSEQLQAVQDQITARITELETGNAPVQ